MMTIASRLALAAGALAVGPMACAEVAQGEPNVPELTPGFAEQTRAPEARSAVQLAVEELATGLEHPWGVAVLPGGAVLVTERPGRLRVVGPDGSVSAPVAGLPEVVARGQGGLLDVAVGPDFAEDRMVYWTYAKPVDGGSATAAARGRLSEDLARVADVTDIFVQEPPAARGGHFGSRIVFEPEGQTMFITTGERQRPQNRVKAQDLHTTYGKVVRIRPDGSAPPDNPFVGDPDAIETIWSYGHRNIQGAALDPDGRLWTVEHGPQGGDELNMPQAGMNYGWPVITYGEDYDGTPIGDGISSATGMEQPVYYWDPVIAPSGMTFYQGEMFPEWQGSILIGSLTPGALVRLQLADDMVVGEERLLTDRGRIRDVVQAPDGALLVLTDADDGALLRLTPEVTD
jgi:glucose/arabinose dehydrogenase